MQKRILFLILSSCAGAAPFFLNGCSRPDSRQPAVSASAGKSADAAPAAAVSTSAQKVVGRWLREDGGYVLDVQGVAPGGVVRAAYFNPNPISVSRAAWLETAGGVQLLVELTGSGYNGSTYVLRYDPATDRLQGEYRQAVQHQTYQIEFVRQSAAP